MIDVKKYVGRAYDKINFNCYTLVRAIQADLGRSMPDIDIVRSESYAGRAAIVKNESQRTIYEKISLPIDGCIVIMRYTATPTHCGVYIGNGQVIHCVEDRGCVIQDIDTLNITGFYNVKKD